MKRHGIAGVNANTQALALAQGASPRRQCPGFAPAASGPCRHATAMTSGTPRARVSLRLTASGKMVYARMRIGVRCRGRPLRVVMRRRTAFGSMDTHRRSHSSVMNIWQTPQQTADLQSAPHMPVFHTGSVDSDKEEVHAWWGTGVNGLLFKSGGL